MARSIDIGDRVAIIATVGRRIEDRVALHIPTANYPHSTVDPNAKSGQKMRFDREVVHVDEELRGVTVEVLGRVTVDASTEKIPSTERRNAAPRRADLMRQHA